MEVGKGTEGGQKWGGGRNYGNLFARARYYGPAPLADVGSPRRRSSPKDEGETAGLNDVSVSAHSAGRKPRVARRSCSIHGDFCLWKKTRVRVIDALVAPGFGKSAAPVRTLLAVLLRPRTD